MSFLLFIGGEKRGGRRGEMSKREKEQRQKQLTEEERVLKNVPTILSTSAFYRAVQFLHNAVHSQQYFSFQHLSQVRHTVHSKYPDL